MAQITRPLGKDTSLPTRILRVLIVEDDAYLRDLLREKLNGSFQFHIHESGSATEAIQKIQRVSFDLIVCDLYIGTESGLDVYRFLKQNARDYDPFFILFSSDLNTMTETERADVIAVPKGNYTELITVIESMAILKNLSRKS